MPVFRRRPTSWRGGGFPSSANGLPDLKRAVRAALFLFVATLMIASPAISAPPDTPGTLVIRTSSSDVTFEIETASTPGEQARGLMFRRSLAGNAGMLFTYNDARIIGMWMRNTYISLDMIFIAADGRIAHIARETEPFSEETITSVARVTAVLEIAGGRADALGIRLGDQVLHPHFTP